MCLEQMSIAFIKSDRSKSRFVRPISFLYIFIIFTLLCCCEGLLPYGYISTSILHVHYYSSRRSMLNIIFNSFGNSFCHYASVYKCFAMNLWYCLGRIPSIPSSSLIHHLTRKLIFELSHLYNYYHFYENIFFKEYLILNNEISLKQNTILVID